MGIRVVKAELLQNAEVVRHDPRTAANVALRLVRANRRKRSKTARSRRAI